MNADTKTEFSLACEYFRERKKRGKASRKDLAQQQAAAAAAGNSDGNAPLSPSCSSEDPSSAVSMAPGQDPIRGSRSVNSDLPPPPRPPMPGRSASVSNPENCAIHPPDPTSQELVRANSMGTLPDQLQLGQVQHVAGIMEGQSQRNHMDSPTTMSVSNFGMMAEYNRQVMSMGSVVGHQSTVNTTVMQQMPQQLGTPNSFTGFNDPPFSLMSPHPQDQSQAGFPFTRPDESPLANFMTASAMGESPSWLALPSPSTGNFSGQFFSAQAALRYPVLRPLVPKLKKIIPVSLACDLLDLYFASSSAAHMHPLSPYLLGFVFRKRSILHATNPRSCSPALLASMLWVAAQTSDASFLTSPPSARGKICQKLLELTVGLLKPLIHGPPCSETSPNFGMSNVVSNAALGGLRIATNSEHPEADGVPTATLDDVATYFHIATVVSASEYKASSMRWWNSAWSLARELKLGKEMPPNAVNSASRDQMQGEDVDAEGEVDLDAQDQNGTNGDASTMRNSPSGVYSEEDREERRRMWWLLYTVDRHLAICYNRPLFLLDTECSDLLQPAQEDVWQAGEYYDDTLSTFVDASGSQSTRHRGPTFECTSHSIFGFFTPLMTILGEIVELNQARNHPRFGAAFRPANEWDDRIAEITHQLDAYAQSLKEFEVRHIDPEHRPEVGTPSVRSVASGASRITESIIQTKTAVAYGTHVVHVLHILLTGKWDPISLLDDSDLWISSQSFITSMQHAVSGAEAISDILEYDPDLSFMPFFFGIYLLQGSFLLLLIADKLQGEANQNVVGACEIVVRAVEACVVTLNTEYQVSIHQVPCILPEEYHTNYISSAISERLCAPPWHRSREGFLKTLANLDNEGERSFRSTDGRAMELV